MLGEVQHRNPIISGIIILLEPAHLILTVKPPSDAGTAMIVLNATGENRLLLRYFYAYDGHVTVAGK